MRKRLKHTLAMMALAAFLCLPAAGQGFELVATYPLDPELFTQGLEMVDGRRMLSSGLYGQSMVGEVDLASGQLINAIRLPEDIFAEGITATEEGIWLLSWQEGEAWLLDRASLQPVRSVQYDGEGWGICYDGDALYMTDGTFWLSRRDPVSFALQAHVMVSHDGGPIWLINELEWANGFIYANVWMTDDILKIDPETGHVMQVIDMSSLKDHLHSEVNPEDQDAVLNGIAHIEGNRFYVTGKRWPRIFEVILP